MFEFNVPLNEKLELVAKANGLEDSSVVEKVTEPHKDYILEIYSLWKMGFLPSNVQT